MKRSGAFAPVILTGFVVALSQGWFSELHRRLWNATRTNDLTGQAGPQTAINTGKWLPVFGAYAVMMISVSQSDRYGPITDALAWLVAAGAAAHFGPQAGNGFNSLIGQPLSNAPYVPGHTGTQSAPRGPIRY